jgi:putative transcriptional regulator
MGLVVNRLTELRLPDLLPDEGLGEQKLPVYAGGPVAPGHLLFLVGAKQAPPSSERVLDGVHVTGSMDAVRPLLESGGSRLHGYVGYAGWAPGQIDAEVARGDWHVVPADSGSVFTAKPGALWQRLLERAEGVWADALDGLELHVRGAVGEAADDALDL